MTRCLRQLIRPSNVTITRVPGVGDCQTCTTDPVNNPKCRMYQPVTMSTLAFEPFTDEELATEEDE